MIIMVGDINGEKNTKSFYKKRLTREQKKKIWVVSITLLVLIGLFLLAKLLPQNALEQLGNSIPLPLFTALIAIIDGFNPCNLMVLTLLASLMLTESHSRKRILAVGLTFIGVVYIFYFTFMAAWLNIFKFIGFIDPLRFGIAAIAIIAGLINVKELFFYRKGITLMVQDKFVGPLQKRIRALAHLVKTGSLPTLIGASIILAIFASLVELPCTAGFPIIYTGILISHAIHGLGYYAYLALYNLFYILPLLTVIVVFAYSFKGSAISKNSMAIIKFVGGVIMLVLGLLLLFAPSLVLGV
jgi:cytochrome c biogenesis protein CcdA